uniref:Uncharacterized protein n=1 Tax=Arundo donax TaxID=35708 RepID=A0A0A8Y5W4_ARUDO
MHLFLVVESDLELGTIYDIREKWHRSIWSLVL